MIVKQRFDWTHLELNKTKYTLLTPEMSVLSPHCDVDAVVLGAPLRQRLLQGHGVQHEAIIKAAGDVVHLRVGRRCLLNTRGLINDGKETDENNKIFP